MPWKKYKALWRGIKNYPNEKRYKPCLWIGRQYHKNANYPKNWFVRSIKFQTTSPKCFYGTL